MFFAGLQTWRAIIFSRVCLSVCLWLALLPVNINRFWRNLVTRTLLWSSLAATITVQIGRRGTVRRLFENLKKILKKSQSLIFKILVHHFWCLCLLCIVKKFDSIRTKLVEEIDFEIWHSSNLPPIEWYVLTGSGLQHQRAAAVDEQHRHSTILHGAHG